MLDDSRTPEPSAMPLGWHISVYRQQNDGSSPASFGAGQGPRLAVWQTGLDGLRWLDDLVKQKNAIDLGGNGYPIEYTAMAGHIIPRIRDDPPEAKAVWSFDAGRHHHAPVARQDHQGSTNDGRLSA